MSFPAIRTILLTIAAAIFLLPPSVISSEQKSDPLPWDKFSANFGIFLSAMDSTVRIGSGLGLDIDVEDFLELETTNCVFRAEALWRFSKNRRHRLDLSWFSFSRDGSRRLLDDIIIEDENGDEVTIPAGTDVDAYFDLDIYQIAYSYSYFQDDRIDLGIGLGVYVMPLKFGISAAGAVEESGSLDFTAPLPVISLRMDIALTPKWFIRSGYEVFYLEYERFEGSIMKINAALEYNPWKHVGVGLGFDSFEVKVKADGEDYPEIDMRGNVKLSYVGLQLYLRLFF